jgi:hypothetical protein
MAQVCQEIEMKLKLKLFTTCTVCAGFTPKAVCAGCCLWALPTMPYMELTSQARPLTTYIQPLQGCSGVLLPPPGSCARRGEGGVHLGACEGAMCKGAVGDRAGFDAVYE